tara:strand:- start:26 stop:127 length:102 start_codon:yes stop_codon:yes gene_type:complete
LGWDIQQKKIAEQNEKRLLQAESLQQALRAQRP